MSTIAVDAMGGDHAPGPEVEGAVAAVRERLAEVVLVGDEPRLRELLGKHGGIRPGLTIRHATQVITMDDHPSVAAKSKKDSSMRVAFDLAQRGRANGEAKAVVSAGNSGAFMACGLFVMKRTDGVDRPAVVTTFPTRGGVCALLDMGLNVDCRPQTLAQFAVLGSVFSRLRHGKARPRVGLLSNGSESSKGTDLTRGTHKLLSAAGPTAEFEYVGYVEGRDVFSGQIDVVVTDGFTGNIVLKTAEGVSQFVFDVMRQEVMATRLGKLGASLLRGAFSRLKKKLDYAEEGGAPLVGVDGVAVLCHGSSNAKAVKNAIRVAAQLVDGGLPKAVASSIERHQAIWPPDVAAAVQGSS